MEPWADLFQAAGARYVVPVTKHHDGFLMWRSDVPNPHRAGWMAERDHVGELAAAVRERGMRFGLYYSGGLDWTFNPPPIRDFMSMITNVPSTPEYGDYALAHVDELVRRFEPSVLWNDIAWPFHLDPADTIGRYYDAVPDGVVNDRFNLVAVRQGTLHADFSTPEYSTTPHGDGKWEVCRGIGRSFAYNRMESEATMPSVDELVWMLADIVGRGGNLLLNVGPTADGQIPLAHVMRLTALGWWLRVNGDAIYSTRPRSSDAGGSVVTTGDGREILPFHANLIQAAIAANAGVLTVSGNAETNDIGDNSLFEPGQPLDVSIRFDMPDESAELTILGGGVQVCTRISLRVNCPFHLLRAVYAVIDGAPTVLPVVKHKQQNKQPQEGWGAQVYHKMR